MHHGMRLTDVLSKVLAVDLLNPSPTAEARKHKLKVRPHEADEVAPLWGIDA